MYIRYTRGEQWGYSLLGWTDIGGKILMKQNKDQTVEKPYIFIIFGPQVGCYCNYWIWIRAQHSMVQQSAVLSAAIDRVILHHLIQIKLQVRYWNSWKSDGFLIAFCRLGCHFPFLLEHYEQPPLRKKLSCKLGIETHENKIKTYTSHSFLQISDILPIFARSPENTRIWKIMVCFWTSARRSVCFWHALIMHIYLRWSHSLYCFCIPLFVLHG